LDRIRTATKTIIARSTLAAVVFTRSDTFGGFLLGRVNLKSHADADVAASVAYGKRMKLYPLSAAATPPETVFTDVKDVDYNRFLLVPSQAIVAQWLQNFKEFPVRQRPASFDLDEVMQKLAPKG
jgi:hypothetical protein